MKTTLVCKSCRKQFEVAETMYESYGASRPTAFRLIPVCPFCGSEGIEEKKKPVTKEMLRQYVSLKKETEAEEERLGKLRLEGKECTKLCEQMENHKLRCMALLIKLQSFIYSIDDSQTRRIFTLRYIEGKTWNYIANEFGGYVSADCLRIAHDRFLSGLRDE